MKKLPIIMSALALFASASGITIAKNVLAEETSVAKADILHTEANIYDWGGLLLTQIDPKDNHLMFYPAGAVDEWDTLRFVFAYQNYEAGVSKSEADVALKNLGVANEGELVILHDQDVRDQTQSPEWLIRPQQRLFDNKTDRIYYAIEHGERVVDGDGKVSWKDVWWERGEIDYRSCIHSAKYNYNTTVCNQIFRDDAEMREFDYLVASYKDGELLSQFGAEDIISWEDEWQQIQQERIEEAWKDLTNVQDVIMNLGTYLNSTETTLDKLDITLAVTENAGSMLFQVSELREILDELKGWLKEHDLSEANLELEALQKELAQLKEKYEILKQEKEALALRLGERDVEIERLGLRLEEEKSERDQLAEENRALEEQLVQLAEENRGLEERLTKLTEQDSQVSQDDRGGVEQSGQIEQNFGSSEVPGTKGNDDLGIKGTVAKVELEGNSIVKEAEVEKEVAEEKSKEANKSDEVATAETPLLGEVETGVNPWWLISGITLVGMVGLCLIRRRRNH